MTYNRYLVRISGWSAVLSGLFFVLVTAYLFGFLMAFGFQIEMLDDHTLLQPWVFYTGKIYQMAWLLYFLTQFFALLIPVGIAEFFSTEKGEKLVALNKVGKVLGVSSITLAMLGPIIFYAITPVIANAYMTVDGASSQTLVLIMNDLLADVSKEVRLFTEVILGIWLMLTGYLFVSTKRAVGVGRTVFALGVIITVIPAYKIFNPNTPLEDYLGLVLAAVFLVLGWHMLRVTKAALAAPEAALNDLDLIEEANFSG